MEAFLALITPLAQPSPPVEPPSIWPGPRPSHPITLPGMPGWGSGGPVDPGWVGGVAPGTPPGIWGGGPHPTPPIYIPGTGDTVPVDPGYFPPGVALPLPPEEGGKPTKAYIVAYVPGQGRMTFLVELPQPTTPTEPAPK